MIALLVGLLLLSWLFGRSRGLLGALAGGFLGVLVLAGMATTASNGDLATLYSPAQLAASVIPVAVVAAGLALVAPYATGIAALGWGVGALLAAIAAPRTGQAAYLLSLAAHLLASVLVMRVAAGQLRPQDRSHPSNNLGQSRTG